MRSVRERRSLFLRKSVGLKRSLTVHDLFVFSALSISLSPTCFIISSLIPMYTPCGSLIPAIIVSFPITIVGVAVYCILSYMMPKTGGEYIWQTRILSKPVAYALNFCRWIATPIIAGSIYGEIVNNSFLIPVLICLYKALNDKKLLDLTFWFSSKDGVFVSIILVVGFSFILSVLSVKNYGKIMKILFYGGLFGTLIITTICFLTPKFMFVNAFNDVWSKIIQYNSGVKLNYLDIITEASKRNPKMFQPLENALYIVDLQAISIVSLWNLHLYWGTSFSGEIKKPISLKNLFLAFSLGGIIMNTLAIVLLPQIWRFMGYEFYQAISYLYWASDSLSPLYPYPPLLITLHLDPWFSLVIIFLVGMWVFGWIGMFIPPASRVVFAMAFDRTLPKEFGEIRKDLRSPLNASLLLASLTLFFGWIRLYTPLSNYIGGILIPLFLTYMGTGLTAILLPYTKPVFYSRKSPIKHGGGKLLLVMCGLIFTAYIMLVILTLAINLMYRVENPLQFSYLLTSFLTAIVIYYWYKWNLKRRRIDLTAIYKRLPPE